MICVKATFGKRTLTLGEDTHTMRSARKESKEETLNSIIAIKIASIRRPEPGFTSPSYFQTSTHQNAKRTEKETMVS
jgi:hypothetical protein